MISGVKNFWKNLHARESYTRVERTLIVGHAGLLVLLLLFAGANVSLRSHLLPFAPTSDTLQYIETAQHLTGDVTAPVHGHRILKPLAPLTIAWFTLFTNGDYVVSMEYVSILFYFLLAVLIYFFVYAFLHSRSEAFYASLIYIGSYPLLMYGLDLYTETGAWFFHLLGLYFAVRYYQTPSMRLITAGAAAVALGFLWKEYAALAGLALLLLVLLAHISWRQKVAHLCVAALIALPVLIGWQLYVYQTYNYSYLDWFAIGQSEPDETSQFSLLYMGKSLFALLLLGWLFVATGVLKWKSFSKKERVMGFVLGLTSLGFLSWGYVSSRLYFVLAPFLTVLAGRGSSALSSHTMKIVSVGIVVLGTYAWLIARNTPLISTWLSAL